MPFHDEFLEPSSKDDANAHGKVGCAGGVPNSNVLMPRIALDDLRRVDMPFHDEFLELSSEDDANAHGKVGCAGGVPNSNVLTPRIALNELRRVDMPFDDEFLEPSSKDDADASSSVTPAAATTNHDDDHGQHQEVRLQIQIDDPQELAIGCQMKPKIQKVPPTLRQLESNRKCFDPLVVAIGPFHHGKPELEPMQALKIQFAHHYAKASGKSIKKLYGKVEKQAIQARNCYHSHKGGSTEGLFNDEKKFAKMMFLDTCFLLQFIENIVYPHNLAATINYYFKNIPFLRHDILLLENQLPFEFLYALMRLRYKDGTGEEMIHDFIEKIMKNSKQQQQLNGNHKVQNNDDLLRYVHLLELVRSKFIDVNDIQKGMSNEPSLDWCSYRSVKELKAVGINFEPSHKHQISDITFKSRIGGLFGSLRLPSITVYDSTKSMLLNLVAYEACSDTPVDLGVSSYVYFMDTLIDDAEDVKELRSKGVIINHLGSDEQVAKLFNEISENLVVNEQAFGEVKRSLERHCRSRKRLLLAECLHTHFRSPWTVIAFFTAIAILGLTIAQTVLSAI